MILLIDNHDSFVYNLARYVRELGFSSVVKRNNAITIDEIAELNPSHIIISPGPCTPVESGISLAVIKSFASVVPILGVCLGHQAIAHVFGATVTRAVRPMHGKSTPIIHDEKKIFAGVPNPFHAGRYHSLIVHEKNFPAELCVTARCDRGEIMALQHREYPLFGVQFHPESVLTEGGYHLLKNFLILS